MGDIFPFDEAQMEAFAQGPCEQTVALYEHATLGSCNSDRLHAMIDEVNQACCTQDGRNVCGADSNFGCDAECGLTFVPFW